MHRRRALVPVLFAVVLAATLSCSDSSGPGKVAVNWLPALIVSPPIDGAASSVVNWRPGSAARASAALGGAVAYISLPPGSVPDALAATITNEANGASISARVVDGGFDPVAIPAHTGDTLVVAISRKSSGSSVIGFQVVGASRSVRVVRTNPPPGKVDVPLNAVIVVVFSAPMDSASLSSAITLSSGGTPVTGSLVIPPNDGDILEATFVPATPLPPLTAFLIDVGTAARDRSGNALAAPVAVQFTTSGLGVTVNITGPLAGDNIAAGFVAFRFHVSSSNGFGGAGVFRQDSNGGDPGYLAGQWWSLASAPYYLGDDVWVVDGESLAPGVHTFRVEAYDSTYNPDISTTWPPNGTGSATISITVRTPDSTPRIRVKSFSFVEYSTTYSNNGVVTVGWSYAPQLVVEDGAGESGVDIIGFQVISFPGLDGAVAGNWGYRYWARSLYAPAGQWTKLFRSGGDHFELELSASDGHRSTGGAAVAQLTYRDANGHVYVTTITGSIVPGAPPASGTIACPNWLSVGPLIRDPMCS